MSDPGILANLAEEVLAVDESQPAAPKALEVDAEPAELPVLSFRHQRYDFPVGQASCVLEALADAVPRARSRHQYTRDSMRVEFQVTESLPPPPRAARACAR